MAKNLIIYYSRKGENYVNGSLKMLEKGNTETAAEFIRKAVGGDMFEVETLTPYSESYNICIEQAKRELQENARPALKKYLSDISQYDNIFVCGPCWWGTFPMAIFSQLERLDFTGKKVRHTGVEPKPVFTGIFPPILRQPHLTYASMPSFGFLVLTKICSVKTAMHPTANEFEVIFVS